jgi:hypothetical protein
MKKTHLMFQETPSSLCGLYLGNNSGMIQTFKLSEVTCKKCIKEIKKAVSNLLTQYVERKKAAKHGTRA